MNRMQEASHKHALKLIDMFERGETSKDIAREMGWNTKLPGQMVTSYVKRYRARGYKIGERGCKK
jgi:hypothetical protein